MLRLSLVALLLSACVQDVAMFAKDNAEDAQVPTTATLLLDVPSFETASFDTGVPGETSFTTTSFDVGNEASSPDTVDLSDQ